MTQVDTSVAETKIVNAVRTIIAKATPADKATIAQPSVILINFDGAGQALTVGMAGLVEVTFPCRILGCHIYAGIMTTTGPTPDIADASVYLGLATQGAWAVGSRTLYANIMPTISGVAEADVSVAGWTLDLQPGDLIPYGLVSFVGTATFLTLALPVRRLDVRGIGVGAVANAAANTLINNAGNTVVQRTGG